MLFNKKESGASTIQCLISILCVPGSPSLQQSVIQTKLPRLTHLNVNVVLMLTWRVLCKRLFPLLWTVITVKVHLCGQLRYCGQAEILFQRAGQKPLDRSTDCHLKAPSTGGTVSCSDTCP